MYLPIGKMFSWGFSAYRGYQWWKQRQEKRRRQAYLKSAALTLGAIACAIVGMVLLAR